MPPGFDTDRKRAISNGHLLLCPDLNVHLIPLVVNTVALSVCIAHGVGPDQYHGLAIITDPLR